MTDNLPMLLPAVGDTIPEILRFLTMTKVVEDTVGEATKNARARLREKIEEAEDGLGLDGFVAKSDFGTAQITAPSPSMKVTDPEAFYEWSCASGKLGPWTPMVSESVRVNPNVDDGTLVHALEAIRGDGCDDNQHETAPCPYGMEDHEVFLLEALEISTGYLLPSDDDLDALTHEEQFSYGNAGEPCRWLDTETGAFEDIPGTTTKLASRQLRVAFKKEAKQDMLRTLTIRTQELE